jgi:spermidine/putrescine transport system ATP-binding protein
LDAIEYRDVVKQFGPVLAVDHVSLQIRQGEFFSLLGPSGCGKTTTLRMAAGFETPTQGAIFIDDQLQNPLPPYRRPVNTVFQQYALFPHMTVFQNVAFGLEMERVTTSEKWRRVMAMLEMVQLNGLESRRPPQLSGGQQQRVALARALVKKPKVLLLDEPLGALDLKLRKAMQLELKALQNQVGITFIYVTHDQEEALTMSDRIAVMRDGVVLQVGTPMEVYERPNNRFVADFIGETNFIPGKITSLDDPLRISLADGIQVLAEQGEVGLALHETAVVSIRPEKISLFHPDQAPATTGRNIARILGRVQQAIYLGTDTRYLVQVSPQVSLVARLQNLDGTENRFHPGEPVEIRWDAHHARVLKE